MPIYMIERKFAERLDLSPEDIESVKAINDEVGVEWLYSFLSADRMRTYCLYQANSAEDILRAAERAGIPANEIVEVDRYDPRVASA